MLQAIVVGKYIYIYIYIYIYSFLAIFLKGKNYCHQKEIVTFFLQIGKNLPKKQNGIQYMMCLQNSTL